MMRILIADHHAILRQGLKEIMVRLVGAPLVVGLVEGTHEGCPYEAGKMLAKKTRIHDLIIQNHPQEVEEPQ